MKAISCPLMLKSTILASKANIPISTTVARRLKELSRALSYSSTAAPASNALLITRNSHRTSWSELFPVKTLSAAGSSTLSGDVKA